MENKKYFAGYPNRFGFEPEVLSFESLEERQQWLDKTAPKGFPLDSDSKDVLEAIAYGEVMDYTHRMRPTGAC